jgi:hypothetical protein
MAGPGGAPLGAACADFDGNEDGAVSLRDFASFQTSGPSVCIRRQSYADVYKQVQCTGASAKIRTRATTLCGEGTKKNSAQSAAWVAFMNVQNGAIGKWIQMGYVRERSRFLPLTTAVKFQRYAETQAGPNVFTDYDFHADTAPASGIHEYRCRLVSSLFGTIMYEYDNTPFHSYTHNGWKDVKGTHYQYSAEILNRDDQMVGTSTAKCDFTDCMFQSNYGTFAGANLVQGTRPQGDFKSDDPKEWGIDRVSATAFDVWDKKP